MHTEVKIKFRSVVMVQLKPIGREKKEGLEENNEEFLFTTVLCRIISSKLRQIYLKKINIFVF